MKKQFYILFVAAALSACCNKASIQKSGNLKLNKQDTSENLKGLEKFEYEIDQRLHDCITENSTTQGMNKCTLQAIEDWEREIKRYYELLLDTLEGPTKQALIESQKSWDDFSSKELSLNNAYYDSKEGTMWSTVALGDTEEKIKQRALQLKVYYEMLKF